MLDNRVMDFVADLIPLLVKPGHVCVDVGANVGETAEWMLQAGASTVICVEPMPKWAAALRQRLSFELHEVALADGSEHYREGWFAQEDSNNPGNGGLSRQGEALVTVTTLDAMLGDRVVDFIKIDVEGMELPVLRGAVQTLARCHPTLLFETRIEFEQAAGAPLFEPIATLLKGLGYGLFDFQQGALCPADVLLLGWNTVAIYP